MKSQRWQQINTMLEAALVQPFDRWDAYLDAQCENDPSLRGEIAAILEACELSKGLSNQRSECVDDSTITIPGDVSEPLIGRTIDGYEILELVGHGGMGVVYKARDLNLDKLVALKMIDPLLACDEAFVRSLYTEARILARVDSPHIVRVHALRQTEAGLFTVMEFVDGSTIDDLMQGRRLSVPKALTIIDQVLVALDHAHAAGIIHRDIKLSNIMLTSQGVVKVMDFGLAKIHEPDVSTTLTRSIAGTPHFMSPEQITGSLQLDQRSDLYSFGVAIYLMVTGHLPFEREGGAFAVMQAIIEEEAPLPSQYNPALSESFDEAIMKALEKNPDRRYQSAAEMRAAFEDLLRIPEAETIDEANMSSPQKRQVHRGTLWGAIGLGITVLASAVMVLPRPTVPPAKDPLITVELPFVDTLEVRWETHPSPVSNDSLTTRLESVTVSWLDRARDLMQARYPNPDQAWPHVRGVLDLDPANQDALRLQADIAATYLRWGDYYGTQGDHAKARSFYRRSLHVQFSEEAKRRLVLAEQMPGHEELKQLPPRPLEHRQNQPDGVAPV